MSFDRDALAAQVAAHDRVARVVVAAVEGSAPREPGAAMLVWPDGQSGTIGGGELEYRAAAEARSLFGRASRIVQRIPLGPGVGQCCGGRVVLATEVYDAAAVKALTGPVVLRRLEGDADAPMDLRRAATRARNAGAPVETTFRDGWLLEPVAQPHRALWIFGAGHVGRALVDVMAPLPGIAVTWVDTDAARFPDIPDGVTQLVAANPAEVVRYAPAGAEHLVLTYSHALDLEICHRLLGHGFADAGLIGSKTKWARFRSRLAALGHAPEQIARIRCPIGDPRLGKHPRAIAVGVAAEILARGTSAAGKGEAWQTRS